jgi:hypothetical protein
MIKEEPVTHVPKRTQWLPSLRDECVLVRLTGGVARASLNHRLSSFDAFGIPNPE